MIPLKEYIINEITTNTVIIGTGAAGFNAASQLFSLGQKDIIIISENVNAGTSRNTGSDKQTYYKLSLSGSDLDSVRKLAEDLFNGQCVDGDIALCEAALSSRCFYNLVELGVPFPHNEYGEYIGYKTDHDSSKRATSAGPYTSKIMTECLEKDVRNKKIKIFDNTQAIKFLVRDNSLTGVLCLEKNNKYLSYIIIWCQNAILATGGPAGMYMDSVYPPSQLGSSGIAFEAGVKGKNLTEWQFGMASVNPRWNVSGTYMQALPKFISANQDGTCQREFLLDYFNTSEEMLSFIFLKGYQWPFDVDKIFGGSSLIDLIVYNESIIKGRKIYLDFRNNTGNQDILFENLSQEAYEYLKNSNACFGTPLERLLHLNEPAFNFYKDHGIDLSKDMLEIRICVQHNNGGLSTDCNWETNIKGLFAVGEVCGSHGVTRPGGTALNAGQAGSLRAANYIAHTSKKHTMTNFEKNSFIKEAEDYIISSINVKGETNLNTLWEKASSRMSRCGGMIRNETDIKNALNQVVWELSNLNSYVKKPSVSQMGLFYHLLDMLISQKVYLSAMLDYIQVGGRSRGSSLYTCLEGEKPTDKLSDLYSCILDNGSFKNNIQEIKLKNNKCIVNWRKVRKIPDPDYCFETQWKAYRKKY